MTYRFICFECDACTSYDSYPSGSSWICPECGAQDNALVEAVDAPNIGSILSDTDPLSTARTREIHGANHNRQYL